MILHEHWLKYFDLRAEKAKLQKLIDQLKNIYPVLKMGKETSGEAGLHRSDRYYDLIKKIKAQKEIIKSVSSESSLQIKSILLTSALIVAGATFVAGMVFYMYKTYKESTGNKDKAKKKIISDIKSAESKAVSQMKTKKEKQKIKNKAQKLIEKFSNK